MIHKSLSGATQFASADGTAPNVVLGPEPNARKKKSLQSHVRKGRSTRTHLRQRHAIAPTLFSCNHFSDDVGAAFLNDLDFDFVANLSVIEQRGVFNFKHHGHARHVQILYRLVLECDSF